MKFNPDDAITDLFDAGIRRIRTSIRQAAARVELCDTLNISHSLDDEAIELFANSMAPHDANVRVLLKDWLT